MRIQFEMPPSKPQKPAPDRKGHLTIQLAPILDREIQSASDLHKIGLVALHPSFILVEVVEPLLIAVAGPLLSIDSSEV